jgi:competence protein ComGC
MKLKMVIAQCAHKLRGAGAKKAQEEMVGFALIIIIVSVILLVFLSFSLTSPTKETVESYEVESFIQASLQYTSDCRHNYEYRSVQDLILDCSVQERCEDDRDSCDVLNSTLQGILDSGWVVGENRPVKGYNFEIFSGNSTMISINEGNETKNSKGSSQDFVKRGNLIDIGLEVYY